jgi:hypothetical protein
MADVMTFGESIVRGERCLPNVRWVPIPEWGNPHPQRKLQQLWQVTTYKDGKPWSIDEEWRDVPTEPS